MPRCRLCEANGEPTEVYSTHNRTDLQKCPYSERHPKELRKKVVHLADDSADDELPAPDLRESFPSPTKSAGKRTPGSGAEPDRIAEGLFDDAVKDTSIKEKDLIKAMHAGRMDKQDVVEILSLRLLDADPDTSVEKRLKKALDIATVWKPAEPKTVDDSEQSENGKDLVELQKRHGKLVGTLAACHKHALVEIHAQRPSDLKELFFDKDTNRTVIRATAHDDIDSWHLLNLVLVDFLYVACHYLFLTRDEARAIHRYTALRGILRSEVVVTFRVVRRLLALIDADTGANLCEVIKREAKSLHDMEVELVGVVSPIANGAGPSAGKDVRPPNAMPKAGDPSLAVPCPRQQCCWWWTNGYKCADLQGGKCKWIAKHGVCGKKIPDPANAGSTTFCTGNHRAKDCPN